MIKRILFICLALIVVLGITACGKPTIESEPAIEMNLNDYYSIEVEGISGEAVASPVGQREMKKDFMQKMGGNVTDMQMKTFVLSIDARVDKQFNVSNGDKITLNFTIDEDLEKAFNLKIKCEPIVLIVEGLPEKEYEQYNPFDNLTIGYRDNEDSIGIFIGSSYDHIQGRYSIEKSGETLQCVNSGDGGTYYFENLKNGDIFTVTYSYDPQLAEENAKQIIETIKEYTIKIG